MIRTAQDLAVANRRLLPGDVLVMADGQWRDADLLLSGEGTEALPIVLRAETPGKVVMIGNSRLRLAGRHLIVDGLVFRGATTSASELVEFRRDTKNHAHFCRLTNCAFIDCAPRSADIDTKWISIYGSRNRVDHCLLRGKTNVGTTLVVWVSDQPNEHRIDHNHFGFRPRLKKNGGETIRVGTSEVSLNNSRTIVEQNLFEQCNGEGEIISNKSCENIYRGNTFVRCEGALTLRHGNRALVAGNFFLGEHAPQTGGVRIIGEDHRVVNNYFADLEGDDGRAAVSIMGGVPGSPLNGYFQVKRAVVAFNTLVDCKCNFVLGLRDKDSPNDLPPLDCTIANNIVFGRHSPLVDQRTTPVRLTWSGNLVFGAPLGMGAPAGIRTADPKLVRAPNGLWRPAAGSPALGAAPGSFPWLVDDIDGQPRTATKDVGCDQASSAPITNRPLTPADVGPTWLLAPHSGK